MLTVTGKHTFPAPPEIVWPRIFDPDSLAVLIPGCEQIDQVGPDEYRGIIRVGIAAVGGSYQTVVKIDERRATECCAFTGTIDGPTGSIQGRVWLTLKAQEDGTCELEYRGQAMISGALATLGGRLIESVTQTLLKQGLARFDGHLRTLQPADSATTG